VLACWAVVSIAPTTGMAAPPQAERNVILVTLDGVRPQELFGGADETLLKAADADVGIEDVHVTRERYWRATPQERREALMPFFWRHLAPQGMVLGNAALGSRVTVRNPHWFSYPGYSEILTGQPQPDVLSNDLVRYPHETVLDHVHRKLALPFTAVAQIGSWDGFKMAASRRDGTFFMNGAFELVPAAYSTPELDYLGPLRRQVIELWAESSNDALTFRMALAYLKKHEPRVLWLGLGQSDDFAHARRYDLVLGYLHTVDQFLAELWTTVQSSERYRDRTMLVVTTDHGRGLTPKDWSEHDAGIPGCGDIWLAIIGPGTPAIGEVRDLAGVTQSDVAATIVAYLGLDPAGFNAAAGPPVPRSLERLAESAAGR
jgi:hypothetical protein